MLAVVCKCGKTYEVDERLSGRTVRCRRCGEIFAVGNTRPAATVSTPPAVDARYSTPIAALARSAPELRLVPDTLPEATTGVPPSSASDEPTLEYENHAHYRMVREFAKGGMGKVSVARDLALKRDVALKELLDEVLDLPNSQRRFVAEAEITGQLEHPGIVPIYALGADERGKPFYAMRLIEGQTLAQAIDDFYGQKSFHRGELKALLRRFVMVCQTVAYAHERGVIHRDLKPANIMLGPFGETLVMDWGLAKPVRDGQSNESTLGDVAQQQLAAGGVTQGDCVVGTPAYMPPEQARGKTAELGLAADIYSLGAVLYHLLTGVPPYSGASSGEVLEQVKTAAPPDPSALRRGVPRALEAICLKAMSRRSKARYPTALALAESVQHWLDDEPVEAYAEPPLERAYRWSRKHKSAVATAAISLVVLLTLGSVGTVLYMRQRDKAHLLERVAGEYQQEAAEANVRASEKEAEAERLAAEAEASRRAANEAVQKESEARQQAEDAKRRIAEIETALAAKTGETDELTKNIKAAKAELADAQKRMEQESQRANVAGDRAAELERQVVALRREADEYREITLKLTRLAAEVTNPREPPAVEANNPWEDFTQRDPASFDVVASDHSEGLAVADTERVRMGQQSLRVSAHKGGGVTVTYPKTRSANWDLSQYDYLTFAFSLGDADVRYRDRGLAVRIGSGSQCIEYRAKPSALSLTPRGWAYVKIPLWGDSTWVKKEVNPLSLSRVDWIEVHVATLDPAVTVWLSDIAFGADPRHIDRELVPDPDRAAAEYVVATKGEAQAWVSGQNVTIRTLADIPKEPFKVWSIFYSGENDVSDVGLKLFAALTDCKWLGIAHSRITDNGLEHLPSMLGLERLNIGGTGLSGRSIKYLAALPKLTYLGLPSTAINDEGIRDLEALDELTELDVQITKISDESMRRVAALSKLVSLNISNTKVTDRGMESLSGHPRLTSVYLWGTTTISEKGLSHLRELPSGLQNLTIETVNAPQGLGAIKGAPLQSLTVSATPTRGRIEDSFLESLTLFPDLRELSLLWAIIDKRVVDRIAKIESVRVLHLGPSNLETCGPALRELAALSKLESLHIHNIGDREQRELAVLKGLRSIDFHATTVEPTTAMMLEAALPNCRFGYDVSPENLQAIDALRGKK
ncbi:MAG TPA: protein kinase [Pirellulales bacterium]